MLDERYVFTLKYHTDQNATYHCSYPTCQHQMNIIPLGDIYGVYQASRENNVSSDDPETVLFCHDCIQELLMLAEEGQAYANPPHFVDGACDSQSILDAAERIHPSLTPKQSFFTYLPEGPTLEPGEGSNSVKGLRRRRQKQYEIDRVLRRLREDRRVKILRQKHRPQVKPSGLKIETPSDIEPYRDRYKKQGLEWNDRTEQGEERKLSKTTSPNDGRTEGVVDEVLEDDDASTCYCREPNEAEGMVQCSSHSCMFGWIHLRCSGLIKMLDVSEKYMCHSCTGGDPLLFRLRRNPVASKIESGKCRRRSDVSDSEGYVTSLRQNKLATTNGEGVGGEVKRSQSYSRWVAVNSSKSLPMR